MSEQILLTAANDNQHTHRTGFTGNDEWYTPARYIEMARDVMGVIDVDPASNATAQAVVRATRHYTAETNGLDKDWNGKVWMNPPYSRALIGRFVNKLIDEYTSGRCTEAIVLTNNSTDTAWFAALAAHATAVCFPKGRLRFYKPTGEMGRTPPQGQMFTYLGRNTDRFHGAFQSLGFVGHPPRLAA